MFIMDSKIVLEEVTFNVSGIRLRVKRTSEGRLVLPPFPDNDNVKRSDIIDRAKAIFNFDKERQS